MRGYVFISLQVQVDFHFDIAVGIDSCTRFALWLSGDLSHTQSVCSKGGFNDQAAREINSHLADCSNSACLIEVSCLNSALSGVVNDVPKNFTGGQILFRLLQRGLEPIQPQSIGLGDVRLA